MKKLSELPHVKEVRGQGLLVGVVFEDLDSVAVKHACFDRKLLITAIGSRIIRMIPPLTITESDTFGSMKESIRLNADNTANVLDLASKTRTGVKVSAEQMNRLLTALRTPCLHLCAVLPKNEKIPPCRR